MDGKQYHKAARKSQEEQCGYTCPTEGAIAGSPFDRPFYITLNLALGGTFTCNDWSHCPPCNGCECSPCEGKECATRVGSAQEQECGAALGLLGITLGWGRFQYCRNARPQHLALCKVLELLCWAAARLASKWTHAAGCCVELARHSVSAAQRAQHAQHRLTGRCRGRCLTHGCAQSNSLMHTMSYHQMQNNSLSVGIYIPAHVQEEVEATLEANSMSGAKSKMLVDWVAVSGLPAK